MMLAVTAEGPWCGSINGYVNHGCRCVKCRRANAAAQRRYLVEHPEQAEKRRAHVRAIRAGLVEPTVHPSMRVAACGTSAGFERHRRKGEVPCDPCRAARRLYQNEQKRRRRRER